MSLQAAGQDWQEKAAASLQNCPGPWQPIFH